MCFYGSDELEWEAFAAPRGVAFAGVTTAPPALTPFRTSVWWSRRKVSFVVVVVVVSGSSAHDTVPQLREEAWSYQSQDSW